MNSLLIRVDVEHLVRLFVNAFFFLFFEELLLSLLLVMNSETSLEVFDGVQVLVGSAVNRDLSLGIGLEAT